MNRYVYSVLLINNGGIANSYGLHLAENEDELRGIVTKIAMDNNPGYMLFSIDFFKDPLYKDIS